MTSQHFSEIVWTLQNTKNLTKEAIGHILGVTGSTIHRWMEKGIPITTYVRLDIRKKINDYMKVAV